jgi:predicted nucleic acid-binding protein
MRQAKLPSFYVWTINSIQFVDVELEGTLKIADALGIYAYDACMIRCALKYRAPLISLDRNLVNAAKEMKVKVIEVRK